MTDFPHQFGSYSLLKLLAKGGMGEIFLARAERINKFEKYYAVKKLLQKFSSDSDVKGRFIDEAILGARLQHPNIVQVFDLGIVDEELYMATEFVDGFDLRRVLRFCHEKKERIPFDIALFIVREILSGLAYAHRQQDAQGQSINLIHRDISPQNVLVSFEGEVKIIDFGLAKSTQRSQETQANVLLGNFGYMSPEQARGLPLCHRTDLYSAGIVLFELVTRTKRFVDENPLRLLEMVGKPTMLLPSDRVPDVPKEVDFLYMKATAADKEDRFETAEYFREAITDCLYEINPHTSREELAKFLTYLFLGGKPLVKYDDEALNKSVAMQAHEIHQWAKAFQRPKDQDALDRSLAHFAEDAPQTDSHPLMRSCRLGETLTHRQLVEPFGRTDGGTGEAEVLSQEELDAEMQRTEGRTQVIAGMAATSGDEKSSGEALNLKVREEEKPIRGLVPTPLVSKELWGADVNSNAGKDDASARPLEETPESPVEENEVFAAGQAQEGQEKDAISDPKEIEPQYSDVFQLNAEFQEVEAKPVIPTLGSFRIEEDSSISRLRVEKTIDPPKGDSLGNDLLHDGDPISGSDESRDTHIFSGGGKSKSDVPEAVGADISSELGALEDRDNPARDAPRDSSIPPGAPPDISTDPATRAPDPLAWSEENDSQSDPFSSAPGATMSVTTVVREETIVPLPGAPTPKVILDIPNAESVLAWAEAIVNEEDGESEEQRSLSDSAFEISEVSESLIIDFDQSGEGSAAGDASDSAAKEKKKEAPSASPQPDARSTSAATRPLPAPGKVPLPGLDVSSVFGTEPGQQTPSGIRPAAQPTGSRRKVPIREVNPGAKKR